MLYPVKISINPDKMPRELPLLRINPSFSVKRILINISIIYVFSSNILLNILMLF